MDEARGWRPQTIRRGGKAAEIRDPILEPWWTGTRVLAIYSEGPNWREFGTLEVMDTDGGDASQIAPQAIELLARSIRARDAVVDGILTCETLAGEKQELSEPGFVGLDLLTIDGQRLLDVPLLERKRLLEGAIAQSDLVRVSPWARPPVRSWFESWRRAGFRGLVIKEANSRYVPGSQTTEWVIVDKRPDR